MPLLEDFMRIYKESMRGFNKANPIKICKSVNLSVSDVFVIYTTHLPIYGVVIEETKGRIIFAYLTTFLALASVEAVEMRINNLFDTVKLTHLTFEMDIETAKPFVEKLGSVKDLQILKENLKRLGKIDYGKIHKEFFDTEKNRVEIILQLMKENDKIIYVSSGVLEKFEQFAQSRAVAATEKKTIRLNCAIAVCEDLGLRFFFADECENKKGKIYLLGELIFSGHLKSGLLIRNLGNLVHHISEQTMKIEIDNQNNI